MDHHRDELCDRSPLPAGLNSFSSYFTLLHNHDLSVFMTEYGEKEFGERLKKKDEEISKLKEQLGEIESEMTILKIERDNEDQVWRRALEDAENRANSAEKRYKDLKKTFESVKTLVAGVPNHSLESIPGMRESIVDLTAISRSEDSAHDDSAFFSGRLFDGPLRPDRLNQESSCLDRKKATKKKRLSLPSQSLLMGTPDHLTSDTLICEACGHKFTEKKCLIRHQIGMNGRGPSCRRVSLLKNVA